MTTASRPRLLAACSVLALIAAGTASAELPFDFARAPGKLPKTLVPDAYRIDLTPDLDKLTLAGKEAVDIRVLQSGPDIVLNQAGLTLTRATLEDGAQATVTADEKAQTATLHFAKPVAAGRHTNPQRHLLRRLQNRVGRAKTHAGHPVRGGGRPPHVPRLGRAGVQGDVPAYRHHAQG